MYGKWLQLRFIQSQLQLNHRTDITDSPVNRYIHNGVIDRCKLRDNPRTGITVARFG
jgi:hypothetical protein